MMLAFVTEVFVLESAYAVSACISMTSCVPFSATALSGEIIMQSFAELLSQYMLRTGISDSEMARAIGVRRQTIFRWREGLTARVRHRDDILRCAEKLRLTNTER